MGPTTWPTSRAKAVSAKHRAGSNHVQPLRLQGIPWETESYGIETRWHRRSRQPDQVAHTPDVRTRKSRTPPQAGPAPRMKPTHDSGSVFEHGERRAVVRHLQRERQVTMEEVTSATVTGLPLRTVFRVSATAVDSERSGRVEMPSNPRSALRVCLTDAHCGPKATPPRRRACSHSAVPVGRVHGSAPDNAVTPPASRNIHGCARCVLQFSRATRHLCRARDRWAGIFRMPKVRRVLGALCKK